MNYTNKLFMTGEFAALCGVKKQTLFHYDEIGLLKPEYIAENGYRYYSVHQAEIFSMIDMLKEIGMSLREIKDFFQFKTSKNIIELLNEKENLMETKILKMRRAQQLIQNQKKQIEEGMRTNFNQFTIKEMGRELLILSDDILNLPMKDITKTTMSFMKRAKREKLSYKGGALIRKEQIDTGDYLNYANLYVHADQLDLEETFVKEAGKYVVGYHKDSYMKVQETYEKIKEFLSKEGFRICGSSFEEYQYLMNVDSLTAEDNYVIKIMIQVKEK